jgi:hypothetical protein
MVGSRTLESDRHKAINFSQDPNHPISGVNIVIAHQTTLNAPNNKNIT